MMINPGALERQIINRFLGKPYKHEGRTLEGLDCFGIVVLIYREYLNIELHDLIGLEKDWAIHGGNHIVDNYWIDWIKVNSPKFLDGVTFKNHKGISNHGGLMLRGTKFIHCAYKIGVSIGDLNDKAWAKRFSGFYRHKLRAE